MTGRARTNRTLVCYKETWANAKIDPSVGVDGDVAGSAVLPPGRTVATRRTRCPGPCTSRTRGRLRDPGAVRLLAGADLAQHRVAATAPGGHGDRWRANTLGYEFDTDADNGFRPAGLIDLSHTVEPVAAEAARLRHARWGRARSTHSLTEYRAASGALVFSAGTIQWAWGLDADHDGDTTRQPERGHAAGHGERAGGHGRAADHPAWPGWSRRRRPRTRPRRRR